MAVRIKLKIRAKSSDKEVLSTALVNSGFETEKPQLLIPRRLAEEIGLWPPPPNSSLIELGTAGGPVRNYVVPDELEVSAVTNDKIVGPATCDAIISHIEEEVLINDKLGEALGIVILRLGAGYWRFADDSPDVSRKSESPKYWT